MIVVDLVCLCNDVVEREKYSRVYLLANLASCCHILSRTKTLCAFFLHPPIKISKKFWNLTKNLTVTKLNITMTKSYMLVWFMGLQTFPTSLLLQMCIFVKSVKRQEYYTFGVYKSRSLYNINVGYLLECLEINFHWKH